MDKTTRGLMLATGVAATVFFSADQGNAEIPAFEGKLWNVAAPDTKLKDKERDPELPFKRAVNLTARAIHSAKARADYLIEEVRKSSPNAGDAEILRFILNTQSFEMNDQQKDEQKKMIQELQKLVGSINLTLKERPKAQEPLSVEGDAVRAEMLSIGKKIRNLFRSNDMAERIVRALTRWELEHRLFKELMKERAAPKKQ